jgi:rubrerythrin
MDIFDFAMTMEREGEQFYRQLSREAEEEGLKTIFSMLADAEVKHYNTLRVLKQGEENPLMTEDAVLNGARNVFQQMKDSGKTFQFKASQPDIYRRALDIEKKSVEFYKEKAEATEETGHQRIFDQLVREEQKHQRLIENLIELVTRPQTWLENAEWFHLDEY